MISLSNIVIARLEAQIRANINLSVDELTPTRRARSKHEIEELIYMLRRRNNPLRRQLSALQQAALADRVD